MVVGIADRQRRPARANCDHGAASDRRRGRTGIFGRVWCGVRMRAANVRRCGLLRANVFGTSGRALRAASVGAASYSLARPGLRARCAGLLGAALGTILLPSLSKSHSNGQKDEFSALLDWGLRLTLLLTLPAAIALAILAVPLLSTLFQYGAFTPSDVLRTREALVAYSIGLAGLILVKVLAPGFYSRQDIRTPVKIALVTLIATQLMNLLFIFGFQLAHAGLALSIGLASCLNATMLFIGLRRRQAYVPLPGWTAFGMRLLLALTVLAAVLWFGVGDESAWMQQTGMKRITKLTLLVMAGATAYLATLWLVGFRLAHFVRRAS